jgi:hypothetical protein
MKIASEPTSEMEDLKKVRAQAKEISRQFSDKISAIGFTDREEISLLTALLWDVFESVNMIYYQLLPAFELTSSAHTEKLGNLLMDIKLELQHIAQHISDADESWLQIANFCYESKDK